MQKKLEKNYVEVLLWLYFKHHKYEYFEEYRAEILNVLHLFLNRNFCFGERIEYRNILDIYDYMVKNEFDLLPLQKRLIIGMKIEDFLNACAYT